MPSIYKQLDVKIKEGKEAAADEGTAKYWLGVQRNFRMYTTKLGNDMFQNGVVRQAQYKFRNRGFAEELDSYEDVIGVGNGILKLGTKCQLVRGFHEYKISKYTETDYKPFDASDPITREILQFYADIYPEPDVLEFILCQRATWLDSRESDCILTCQVGGGQNGKTSDVKFVHNVIGSQYCASGKSSLLVSQFERAESANEAQMQMSGKNGFYFDEFGKCEVLNSARLKSIVNPNVQSGRGLYGRQQNFKNTCNPVALSNFDFVIETTDHGTWRRIYYYKNKVKFCKNPNPNNPYEKQANEKWVKMCPNDPVYKTALLSILCHYYEKLQRVYGGDIKNIPVPTIDKETEEFRNRQDALNRFITQMIVKSPTSDSISLASLACKYVEWYNRNVKPTNQTIVDVQSQFENSRIAASLERRLNDAVFLTGHRLKNHIEEPIVDGEEELCVKSQKQSAHDALNDVEVVREQTLQFGDELQLNAPKYIQRTIDPVSQDNIDQLLDNLAGDGFFEAEIVNL